MPSASQTEVRRQIAAGKVAAIYLILGTDEGAKTALAAEFLELIEPDLRAFNIDRLFGGETTAADLVHATRTLPMMAPRRVVLLLHADRLLIPKKESDTTARDLQALEEYLKAPVDTCCLVLVADSLDKRRSITKLLMSKATVVECSVPADPVQAAKWIRDRVAQAGMTIDPRAVRMVLDRLGRYSGRIISDVERLLLYAADTKTISEDDVREVVPESAAPEDWGMTRALERGSAADALRELGLMIDNGVVPYLILGQLAWYVRSKVRAPKVNSAVDAVFRTDLAIKTSAGEPRALLERLVVELCER